MDDIWTIKAALDWTEGYLERKEDENPRLSAQWLLSAATGLARIDLYTHFDQPLTTEEREVLRGFVTRRGQGEPLQYITGEVGFRYITVQVAPGVLIPRPETEVLVGEGLSALSQHAASRQDVSGQHAAVPEAFDGGLGEGAVVAAELEPLEFLVADLCTGTGCIASSIAHENPATRVIATDIAPEAIQLARKNVATLGLTDRIEVIECDLGAGIDAALLGSFDLVISNPPYVPTAIVQTIPREVKNFEPALALDGGPDGLDVFRRMVHFAHAALKSGGTFAVELHEEGMDRAAHLAEEAGFSGVRIVRDLADKPRVLVAQKNNGIKGFL
ncbi:MAG: peptide chain release factor N(5)-glutamine methyltransferase [Raoultibacter sp.]